MKYIFSVCKYTYTYILHVKVLGKLLAFSSEGADT